MSEKRDDYADAWPLCERAIAELRLYSGTVGPEAMEAALRLPPTGFLKKGRRKTLPSGHERVDRFNAYFLSSQNAVPSLDLRRHLDWLLGRLAGRERGLQQLLATGEVEAAIDCIWWLAESHDHGGPRLRADQLAAVAELGLELSIDFTVIW